MTKPYDVIVVGAGTSGCALAARLSEQPNRSVLLIEAGEMYSGIEAYPPELKYAAMFGASAPGHPNNWGYEANLSPAVKLPLARGRVVGGSSALNGTIFTRGLPEDFDGWAAAGNDTWSYESVLPYFKRLECDQDINDDYHGHEGPIPVQRSPENEWAPVSKAFVSACRSEGFPDDADMNRPDSIGVGALPVNCVKGVRYNTAIAYIDDIVERKNLTILTQTVVRRVLVEGQQAVGVIAQQGDETLEIHAGEVVLAAGAVKSPHILMLSGIGPPDELLRNGIPVLHESPHVGGNFTDHCTVHLPVTVPGTRRFRLNPTTTALAQTGLHYTTPGSNEHSDMMLFQSVVPLNSAMMHGQSLIRRFRMALAGARQMSWHKFREQMVSEWDLTISIIIMRGGSRGKVRLRSADPDDQPILDYGYLEDPEDLWRLREGIRLAARLVDNSAYRKLGAKRKTPGNKVLQSDRLLNEYFAKHVGTSIHTASTCRMGKSPDDSVVDQYCRVHHVRNLRVVDTSIMPTVVRRCPAATAVMIGERASAFFD